MKDMKTRRFGVLAAVLVAVLLVLLPLVVAAQGRRLSSAEQVQPYDGRLTFTRLQYGSSLGGFGFGGAAWSHDYPAADENLSSILDYITNMRVHLDGSNILDLDDPRIFENPVIYLSLIHI